MKMPCVAILVNVKRQDVVYLVDAVVIPKAKAYHGKEERADKSG